MKKVKESSIRRRFARVSRYIKEDKLDAALAELEGLKERVSHKLAKHREFAETVNRHSCPIIDRKLEILDAEGATHRFTINPVDGRMTLKIAKKASETVREELETFVYQIGLFENFPSVTMRGKISWDHNKHQYTCTLYSGSKTFKKSFTSKGK